MSTNEIENVDLLVVGGGKAGKSLAMERAKAGWKVAMVERQFVGGTCINVACIPTKSLVNSARRLSDARSDEAFGVVGTEGAHVDLAKLRAHKEGIVGAMVAAHEKMFAAPGLAFIRGEARFTGERTVTIALEDGGERTIRGERVLINLGSRPARPAIPGLWESGAWTNEEILRLEELPSSLAIIGASYIGVEFASMMATFGVDVTLISSGDHVLPREDEDAARVVEAGLEAAGVRIVPGRAESASREGNTTTLTLSDGSTVSAEAVLVAVGRVPNTDGIGLDEAGVELTDRGFVAVDEHLRTSAQGVWAAGDCAGTPMFTHHHEGPRDPLRRVCHPRAGPHRPVRGRGARGRSRRAYRQGSHGRDSARQDDALRGRGFLEGRRGCEHAPDPGRHADRPERLRGHHGRARRYGRRPDLRAAALPADRAPDHG